MSKCHIVGNTCHGSKVVTLNSIILTQGFINMEIAINFFLGSDNFFCLQITFANSLDPDQYRHNVGTDLDPNRLTLKVFLNP